MKPAPFDYILAGDVTHAVTALDDAAGNAKLIAGGQSLGPMLNLRVARPDVLVDISRLSGLSYLRSETGSLRIGGLTRHAELERRADLPPGYAALATAAAGIGTPAIRAQGTFGGSIAYANPVAEWCVLAVAFGATVTVVGTAGARRLGIDEFLLGAFTTALGSDEMLVEVTLGEPAHYSSFLKTSTSGLATTVAAGVAFDVEDGLVARPRVSVGTPAGPPRRVPDVERLLAGRAAGASPREVRGEIAALLDSSVAPGPRVARVAAELMVRTFDHAFRAGKAFRPGEAR